MQHGIWKIGDKPQPLATIRLDTASSLHELTQQFNQSVNKARAQTATERQQRLRNATKHPRAITVTIIRYERNPDVVAEVLERAAGVCEVKHCAAPHAAPFNRKSDGGTSYCPAVSGRRGYR